MGFCSNRKDIQVSVFVVGFDKNKSFYCLICKDLRCRGFTWLEG